MTYKLAFNESALNVIGVGKRENDAVYKMTRHRS
ncbi:hypothetical protein PVV23_22855 [Salmonella enterica subsp. enterica serovar Typhimurium]|nr:hypothetical protein [Salmonella enterica]MDJ6198977.1 hypothetical protein [Salmonella enterica]